MYEILLERLVLWFSGGLIMLRKPPIDSCAPFGVWNCSQFLDVHRFVVRGWRPPLRAGASGQEGVTIAFDLLLIVIVLPAPDCADAWLFIMHTPNRHMKTTPATAARLMMSGNFILSMKSVATVRGISASRSLLMNVVELMFIFFSSKCS